jgi:hypothetical protein
MRELVTLLLGLVALFGALILGQYLIFGSGDRSGVLGLLLLSGAGLFLQYSSFFNSSRENARLVSQRLSLLEEQIKSSQNKPVAEPSASVDRPHD